MCISGAFSGLAGFIETFGINYRLLDGIAGDAGNIATIVALLGSLNVYGITAAAMFFSVLLCGGAEKSSGYGEYIKTGLRCGEDPDTGNYCGRTGLSGGRYFWLV